MDNKKIDGLALAGIAVTLIGWALNIASGVVSDKKTERIIEQKVNDKFNSLPGIK
jgi:hypothetical protein